ncbi:helicase-related protein [Pelotomaculum propionicicum]|uniref:helicase-related protein n=1 Tax=Pelotomaculum propionicicum TaxID=258475 RepID=UPI003B77934B
MSTHIEDRDEIIKTLKAELVGPWPQGKEINCNMPIALKGEEAFQPYKQMDSGQEILQRDPPTVRYGVGVLYPVGTPVEDNELTGAPELESLAGSIGEDKTQESEYEPLTKQGSKDLDDIFERSKYSGKSETETEEFDLASANLYRPGSMGISFLAKVPDGCKLVVQATGGRYKRLKVSINEKERIWWLRSPVTVKAEYDYEVLNSTGEVNPPPSKHDIQNGDGLDLRVEVYSRPHEEKSTRLITVCLINRTVPSQLDEACLFQSHFIALIESEGKEKGHQFIQPYPKNKLEKPDDEEQSIALLYRNFETYAVGHGCAADWEHPSTGQAVWRVSAECLPECEIPSITSDIKENDNTPIEVSMAELAGLIEGNDGFSSLDRVVSLYEKWIEDKTKLIVKFEEKYVVAARKHMEECKKAVSRMRGGLNYLKNDNNKKGLLAFQLANHAILLQQIRSGQVVRKVKFDASEKRFKFLGDYVEPDVLNPGSNRGKWRAFQIAFLLMSLQSAVDGAAPHRNTVDLIWFPTGGGKTEAYLGLAAFSMFMRRIENRADEGVNVLMRYTLRLLTAQQFQRASGLLCAMEYLRRKFSDLLGDGMFSIGIWLGGTTTPNRRTEAISALRGMQKNKTTDNPFILRCCPWCGAQMGKFEGDIPKKSMVPRVLGYEQIGNTVSFRCIDSRCEFKTGLPIYVIDEDIYEKRPSLVIGTVDKFAMLAWRPDARSLFGIGSSGLHVVSPPGLIIQDELHLISGPLGSMCGIYETAIEELCTDRRGEEPIPPKIVCSTATIRRYAEQIKAIYARKDVMLFPPPGLDASDSFFSCYAKDSEGKLRAGRKYIGVHAPGLRSMQTAQVRTFTALLQAPINMTAEERDPWWTLLLFFNSLRELGTTLSLFQSDIPGYLKVLQSRFGLSYGDMRYLGHLLELTGRLQSDKVPEAIEKLEKKCTNTKDTPVDICLASNIIEVGIDIDRLSLMAIVGQPKTTSQYIQVTGRVGRRWSERPGLIVTLYGASKPRDRSHFEKFKSYHERLYAQVEPTSVTPFSPPAIDRALHAVLVSYVRQTGDPTIANSPYPYPEQAIEQFRDIMLERIKTVDEQEADNIKKVFNKRANEWKNWERTKWSAVWSDADVPLLREAGAYASKSKEMISWATPTSMRNVDAECQVELTQLYLKEGDE